jgi:enoyl-CoA hydratase
MHYYYSSLMNSMLDAMLLLVALLVLQAIAIDPVLVQRPTAPHGASLLQLNRAKQLNCLNNECLAIIRHELQHDRTSDVLLCAVPGRAFSAGGDIKAVAALPAAAGREFLLDEYSLMLQLRDREANIGAVADGIVMGAGAGLFMSTKLRIVTERACFAMPECAIGLLPDAGGSHFLAQMPGAVGLYLALTGARLSAQDMLYTGAATNSIAVGQVDGFLQTAAAAGLEAACATYCSDTATVLCAAEQSQIAAQQECIDSCFTAGNCLEDIAAALKTKASSSSSSSAWAHDALERLCSGGNSPAAQVVAYAVLKGVLQKQQQQQQQVALSYDAALGRELAANAQLLKLDFQEGVAAAVGSKRGSKPLWRHKTWQEARDDPAIVEVLAAVETAPPISSLRQ